MKHEIGSELGTLTSETVSYRFFESRNDSKTVIVTSRCGSKSSKATMHRSRAIVKWTELLGMGFTAAGFWANTNAD